MGILPKAPKPEKPTLFQSGLKNNTSFRLGLLLFGGLFIFISFKQLASPIIKERKFRRHEKEVLEMLGEPVEPEKR